MPRMASSLTLRTLALETGADSVAVLTLNRPDEANAINGEMASELRAVALSPARAIRRCGQSSCSRSAGCSAAAVISACSRAAPSAEVSAYIESLTIDLHAALARFAKMDAPVVAAVTGSAGGAGMSLVAACDLVVAGESAKFTMGYTKAGLVPDGTSSFFLSRAVGLRRACDLVLTNRVLSAADAEQWGLVNRVVPDDAVRDEALALARSLAAGPTKAFGLAKRVLYEGAASSLEDAMERESRYIATAAATSDAAEGIAAFVAKRAAQFDGS